MTEKFRTAVCRVFRAAAAACVVAALGAAGTVLSASGATVVVGRTATVHVTVVPVPGDRYAPPGTSITFRGATPAELRGLSVVGARSGRHTGTLQEVPGVGTVFTPARAFAPAEQVTVAKTGLDVSGAGTDGYTFVTSVPAAPAAAAAALRLAAAEDATGSPATASTATASTATASTATTARRPATSGPASVYVPPSCPTVVYRSEPTLGAEQACMNVGVTTAGTQPGTDLFMTPNGFVDGAGIWADNGDLVWWQKAVPGLSDLDESVVQFQGQPYLALWSGTASSYGNGNVTLYNEHYQAVGEVSAGSDFPANSVDLHEFQVTPAGDALVGIYDPVTVTIGGTPQVVLQYVVQELSLVAGPTGIHTGSVLFEWDSLTDVPVTQSMTPYPGTGAWDYFHGNAITQDPDGDLVVSGRNTWGLYNIDTASGDSTYGHVTWQVGASGDSQLPGEPWCYQHDVTAIAHDEYSLYDDGGSGPGCLPGTTQHPARALLITVSPSTTPAGVTLVQSWTHTPAILTGFTGSAQLLPDGDVLVDWANVPEITEYSSTRAVKMDLSLSAASYRGFRFAWVGQPLTPPSLAVSLAGADTDVWASWNGSTEVQSWQVIAGPSVQHLAPVGRPVAKTNFETAFSVPGDLAVVEVEALSSTGAVLGTSPPSVTSGFLLASSSGQVSGLGDDAADTIPPVKGLASPVVGFATTPDGKGFWLACADGAVLSYGDAKFHGSATDVHLNSPITGIAATADGGGYWLVAGDGGIFNYGDAHFHGSAATLRLNSPVTGIAPAADGGGYWLVAGDGGTFNYGDAHFHGSAATLRLNSPVTGIAPTTDGGGYWLVAGDGGVFNYGDAHFHGSAAGAGSSPVSGIAATADGGGYWVAATSGTVFGYGDAPVFTVPSGQAQPGRVVGVAAPLP